MNFFWAGIGSRKSPLEIKNDCIEIAKFQEKSGGCLRSGGAIGADQFFEEGVKKKEVFVIRPTKTVGHFHAFDFKVIPTDLQLKALGIAKKYHPVLKHMSGFEADLLVRNVFQVLGRDLKSPVKEVVCWTPEFSVNGESISDVSGGTGLAVRLAVDLNIPVFNLGFEPHLNIFEDRLGTPLEGLRLSTVAPSKIYVKKFI